MKSTFKQALVSLILMVIVCKAESQKSIPDHSVIPIERSLQGIQYYKYEQLMTSPGNGYCISDISSTILNPSDTYIISGPMKTGNTQDLSGYFAITNNLRLVLSQTEAFQMQLKFAGYTEDERHIPQYNIVYENLYLTYTKLNWISGEPFFNLPTGTDDQKWIIKNITGPEGQNRVSIFKYFPDSKTCFVLGRPEPFAPTPDFPYIRCYYPYNEEDQYQVFQLIKLYAADPNRNTN